MNMRPITVNIVLLVAAVVLSGVAWLVVNNERKGFTEVDKIPRLFEGFTPDNVRIVILTRWPFSILSRCATSHISRVSSSRMRQMSSLNFSDINGRPLMTFRICS